jgi:hypothetical protein
MNIDEMIADCKSQLKVQVQNRDLATINMHRLQGAISVLNQLKDGEADGSDSNAN